MAVGGGFRARVAGWPSGPHPVNAAIGVRPEAIRVALAEGPETPFAAEVIWIERLGSHHVLDLRLGGVTIRARTRPDHPIGREGPAWLGFTPHAEKILDLGSGRFVAATS